MNPTEITLAFLLFAVVMFVWEKIPLALTAMIVCVGLVLTGVLNASEAFGGFINKNVILFIDMFIIGAAFFETGMAQKVGGLVTKFAKSERQLVVAIMIITGLMSGLLSNTGTAAVLIPVVIGLAAKTGFARSKLLMPVVFAAAMGGNLSLIGAPGNMIAQAELEKIGLGFGFFEFAYIGLPILILGILFTSTIGFKLLPDTGVGGHVKQTDNDFSDVPVWKSRMALGVLALTIICMVFEKQIGIKLHITGAIGAIFLILTRVINEDQAYKSIDMKTIFLFGGTLALALAMKKTGAGELIANNVLGQFGEETSMFVVMFVIFMLAAIMTNFMSNTATTALLVPIGMSISASIGADPRAVMMATVIGGSLAYATPIGMPANAMVLGPGGFKFKDYVVAGLPLIIVSTVVSMILLPILYPFFP
ncbi:SLC13 family permease [Vibrio diazotrophicus]|uniref:Cation transporter n=1 Tax=Vibrio diazotrophicus TaxID=685 RepID=A0ABX4W7Y3_VIBDI|nr:SLC13 family permease [Vibrio diazotrophicus]PNH99859.1 cation transporter [Vibrio diazotrophicus]